MAAIREVAPGRKIHTFSAGFGKEDVELIGAAEVAAMFDTEHHQLVLTPEEIPDLLEPIVWYLEDPAGREETAFYYVTSQEASRHVEILMSGYNADTLYAGMPRHKLVKLAFDFPFLRPGIRDFYAYTRAGELPRTLAGRMLVSSYFKGKAIPSPAVLGAGQTPESNDLKVRSPQPLNQFLIEGLLKEPFESKVERLHTPFGLVFKSPFMDLKVIESAFRIPDEMKIRPGSQKLVLREAFRGRLPSSVIKRGKTLQKLRHDGRLSAVLGSLTEKYLGPEDVRARGIFDPATVAKLGERKGGLPYTTQQSDHLWTMILIEIWARLFLDGRGARPASVLARQ